MIRLIKIGESLAQNVGISVSQELQEIVVKNTSDQLFSVKANVNHQNVRISSLEYVQTIKVSNDCNCSVVPEDYPVYEGEYEATPKRSAQVMPTAEKIMLRDFTVKGIPYSKVSNNGGGNTISIG